MRLPLPRPRTLAFPLPAVPIEVLQLLRQSSTYYQLSKRTGQTMRAIWFRLAAHGHTCTVTGYPRGPLRYRCSTAGNRFATNVVVTPLPARTTSVSGAFDPGSNAHPAM